MEYSAGGGISRWIADSVFASRRQTEILTALWETMLYGYGFTSRAIITAPSGIRTTEYDRERSVAKAHHANRNGKVSSTGSNQAFG